MPGTQEVTLEEIKNNLEFLDLDLNDIPLIFRDQVSLNFRPLKSYDERKYKVYRYVEVSDIDILLTPADRLEDVSTRYKLSDPIECYLDTTNEENLEKNITFLKMIKEMDKEKINELFEEQKVFFKKIPFEVKYHNNYLWQVYYSEYADRYFMIVPTKESDTSAFFYLMQQKIDFDKSNRANKTNTIFIPISHEDYTEQFLKKSELVDIENYLWLYTKDWPSIYEVFDKKGNMTIQIVGETTVYEGIKSNYKIVLKTKDEAVEFYKLLKALFILTTTTSVEYKFKTKINAFGALDFYYGTKKMTYDVLSDFIRKELEEKLVEIEKEISVIDELNGKLYKLKRISELQNEEYLDKQKQIVTFLECRKTFFGKVKYYFNKGGNKPSLKDKLEPVDSRKSRALLETEEPYNYPKKSLYTIEDLTKVCKVLKEYGDKNKKIRLDIKALENKVENLDRKIENATVFIKEIEKHKKSIFEFWKYTNKDEVPALVEGYEDDSNKEDKDKLKKTFNYEEDMDVFGKIVDDAQKKELSQLECDAIFAIREDTRTVNILRQEDILKINKLMINEKIDSLKQEYLSDLENIDKKDFDIFGGMSEDKTKIKVLNNNKHREIEKDKYKILGINKKTTYDMYTDNYKRYLKIFDEAYGKIETPYDISVYKTGDFIDETKIEVFDINPKNILNVSEIESNKINLFRINIPEKFKVLFYSNIIFYDNNNQTLPSGMDVSTEVVIDLNRYSIEKVRREDFKLNYELDKYSVGTKSVTMIEYNLIEKREVEEDFQDDEEFEEDIQDNEEFKENVKEEKLEETNKEDFEIKKEGKNEKEELKEDVKETEKEDINKKEEKTDDKNDYKKEEEEIISVDVIEEMEGIEIKNPNQKEEERTKIKEILKAINGK